MTRADHQQQQHQEPAQSSGSTMGSAAKAIRELAGTPEVAFWQVWNATHPDFRGTLPDGTRTLMSYAKFGGGLVSADTITDAELAERLQEARSFEAKRRALREAR